MRTKYNKRRFRTFIMIIIILFCMSIGYSYLLTTLNIEGTSNIKGNTWDVHWENINVNSRSVTGDQVPIQAHILSDTTQVEYSVILKNPGDYYEFTIDAKNAGSIDAMVSIMDTKFFESNGVTQINLPDYLEYSFTYADGEEIELNTTLSANSTETYKVKLKFKDNLEESELPTTDKTIVIRQSMNYIQADETSTPPRVLAYSYLTGKRPLSMPKDTITGLYSTPRAVTMATELPIFLKHEIKDGTVYTTAVGFEDNKNYYYLKGGINESGLDNAPVFEQNKKVLIDYFAGDECGFSERIVICEGDTFLVVVYKSGAVRVTYYNNGNYGCDISYNDRDMSYCGEYQLNQQ